MTTPLQDRLSSQPPSPRLSSGNATAKSLSAQPGIRTRKSVDEASRDSSRAPEKQPAKQSADMRPPSQHRRARLRSPWSCSLQTLSATLVAGLLCALIAHSFLNRQVDPKGAAMSYMRPAFAKFPDFDTEHTRFATKYSLYLYREGGIDEDTRVKGIPVLFIPGNAGSYKQVRPIAAEAAVHFHEHMRESDDLLELGKRTLDFFSVDFNEDLTAFHGQTLLDQAEYLNEAISYILSLYTNPNRSLRDAALPDPTSVILLGHSMGGVVARTMLTMPNYQPGSVNTILTLAAPHARAPVSFDSDIVDTYSRVNGFWRDSFSKKPAAENSLSNVVTISIAGGGLDTTVPSDYSTLTSLVPATHGFTVFTSTIPRVWTAMDHLAITWCDQLRRALVRSLYDIVDASRPNQTRPLADRMHSFKKWLLTGMEDVGEHALSSAEHTTLLTLEDNPNSIKSQGERLVLRKLGEARNPEAHLLPVPPQGSAEKKQFTLLTDRTLEGDRLAVLFCSVFPLQSGQASKIFSVNLDLSGGSSGATRFACKNAAADAVALPASTTRSRQPFDEAEPFSYLRYDLEKLSEHQFVAVVDSHSELSPGWLIAEFSSRDDSLAQAKDGLAGLMSTGVEAKFPPGRPMVTELKIRSLYSSLLTYRVKIEGLEGKGEELFAPLLRQHISDPFESKFFVNVREADISLHGLAPYMPPALKGRKQGSDGGLTLQVWADPSNGREMKISLQVDLLGSLGKLWMRYRTVFAAFPLLVVALVLRKQFQLYDATGVFMSFSESMDQCLRRSIPVLLVALTFLAVYFSSGSKALSSTQDRLLGWQTGGAETVIDYTVNDLLLGSQDAFFWFLVPLFGLMSIGICIAANYAVLSLTHFVSLLYVGAHRLVSKDAGRIVNVFADPSLQTRLVTTTVLIGLAWTVIPYQFVFIVLCIVQMATCVRALSVARETHGGEHMNLYNYGHSILLLLLWILPINMPILVVWVRNVAVHWLTPFSSHHNILSILPFVLLIETLSTGKMVPRASERVRHLTSVLLFGLAIYAAVYGVTYAYLLHWLVNIVCAWLVVLHASSGSVPGPLAGLRAAWKGGPSGTGSGTGNNGGGGGGGGGMERKSPKKRP